jgi:hypothetical protein
MNYKIIPYDGIDNIINLLVRTILIDNITLSIG